MYKNERFYHEKESIATGDLSACQPDQEVCGNTIVENNWDDYIEQSDPLFVNEGPYANPSLSDPYWENSDPMSFTVPDLRLRTGSPCIDFGGYLTHITSPNGFGTTFMVDDASYFIDGWGMEELGVYGDEIQLQGQTTTAKITNINYETNTITVDKQLSWTLDQDIALDYEGTAPDAGAFEFSLSCNTNADCDDKLYCNGNETCASEICIPGTPPCAKDSYECTKTCDETTESCNVLNNSFCLDSVDCTYNEMCIGQGGDVNGCSYDYRPVGFACNDKIACTTQDFCNSSRLCAGTTINSCINNDGCCPSGCNTENDNDCLPLGMVGWYRFNDDLTDGVATDSTGNYNGACSGNCPTHITGGHSASAYQFNGSDSSIKIGTGEDFSDLCTNGCSFSTWIKPSATSQGTIIGRANNVNDRFFRLTINEAPNQYRFYITSDGDTSCFVTKPGIDYGEWQHIVGVYKSETSSISIYKNGSKLGSANCSFLGIDAEAWQDSENTYIGIRSGTINPFNGAIDEVRVYNRALSELEIQSIYNLPSSQNPICGQFQKRYNRTELLQQKNSWIHKQLTLTELIKRARIWKFCS